MGYKDTEKSGDLKEEVVKSRKEEGQDYFDDYETEKRVFEKDSKESDAFGIDKFEVLGVGSNDFEVRVNNSNSVTNKSYEDSNELEESSSEVDEDSYDSNYSEESEFSEDSEYLEDESDLDYDSDESDESAKDSKKSKSKISEDGDDYNDEDSMKDDMKSSRKTFYQSHIYPMHLLENLKVSPTTIDHHI